MHRISTDADYLKTGKIIIDADGIPVDVPDRTHMEAADQALGQRITDEKWDRGAAPNNDANLLRGDGMEGVWSLGTSGVNLPERLTGYVALVESTHHTAANATRQVAWSVNPYRQNESYERTYWAGAWGEWTARASAKALGERIDLLFPSSIRAGQVLKWDGAKFAPSWLDQHTNLYDNTY